MNETLKLCPCGSQQPYEACCGHCHSGHAASTPEALMRSRYTAFVLKLESYLLDTWHAGTRPANLDLDDRVRWAGLQIRRSGEEGDRGMVEFVARFREAEQWRQLHEISRFSREGGRWVYVDGEAEWTSLQPGRNDPCPCGSGKKFKKCCQIM